MIALAVSLAGCVTTTAYVPADIVIPNAHAAGSLIAFDPSAGSLASAGLGGEVRLWRLPDGAPLARWYAHADQINGLAFVDHGRKLLTAGYDATLALWSREGLELRRQHTGAPFTAMAVDESADLIVTGHSDGTVRAWRLSDLSPITRWKPHRGAVRAVTWHAGSERLASSGRDGTVWVWPRDGTPRQLDRPASDARSLAFSPDGTRLFGGGWFRVFRWDLRSGAYAELGTEHTGIINTLRFDAEGRYLASISRQTDSAVLLLDPQTGATVRRFQPHDLCGTDIQLSRDGRYMATSSDDASVRIWRLRPPKNPPATPR